MWHKTGSQETFGGSNDRGIFFKVSSWFSGGSIFPKTVRHFWPIRKRKRSPFGEGQGEGEAPLSGPEAWRGSGKLCILPGIMLTPDE